MYNYRCNVNKCRGRRSEMRKGNKYKLRNKAIKKYIITMDHKHSAKGDDKSKNIWTSVAITVIERSGRQKGMGDTKENVPTKWNLTGLIISMRKMEATLICSTAWRIYECCFFAFWKQSSINAFGIEKLIMNDFLSFDRCIKKVVYHFAMQLKIAKMSSVKLFNLKIK